MAANFAAMMGQKDFSRKTLKSLSRKGIEVIGIQMCPGSGSMPWANAEKCYSLNDNGTGRIRTHREVLALAS